MKKILSVFMVAAMCVGLAACGGSGTPSGSSSPSASPAETSSVKPSETASTAPSETAGATGEATPSAGSGAAGEAVQAIKDKGEIVMVTSPDFAPYEFIDPSKTGDEQYVGMDIALGKYIAEQLGVKLKIDPMDFDATLAAIGSNSCDFGISGYSPSEDRKKAMDFSDIYYEGDQVIVIRKEDAEKYKTAADLKDKTVAAQNASEQQAIVEGQLEGAKLQQFAKVPEEVMALKTKQVEAVALEGPNAKQIIDQNDDLMVSEIKVEGSTAGTAVAIPKGKEDLVEEINKIIAQAKEEGLVEKWLEEAVEINQGLNN